MLREYSPASDGYVYIDSPLHQIQSTYLELSSLLANATADTPVGYFLKILLEDSSRTCPVSLYVP